MIGIAPVERDTKEPHPYNKPADFDGNGEVTDEEESTWMKAENDKVRE